MTTMKYAAFASNWKEIASGFLKLGVTAYGGPAIMGLMQVEFQEKRQWIPKERFVEGLSLANLVPGATATQLGIFLGHVRGGWWGGLLAGLCFVLPAFGIMLALAMTYAHLGATPIMRGGLYGLGPVVLGIFVVAVYRLGRSTVTTVPQILIAITAAALAYSPLGIAAILALAAGVGLWLFHARRVGAWSLIVLTVFLAVLHVALWVPSSAVATPAQATASTHPKVAGLGGAVIAATASFLPSFLLMLSILPVFERVRTLVWARAAMRGIGPAVIGVMAVFLVRMAPHALPDPWAVAMLIGTLIALLAWRIGALKLISAGAVVGMLRSRLFPLPGVRAIL